MCPNSFSKFLYVFVSCVSFISCKVGIKSEEQRFSKTNLTKNMAPKVERIQDIDTVELGEGPHWDAETQSLYFVDIFGEAIHKYVPRTRKHTKAMIGTNRVSLIVPVKNQKDKFLISIGKELVVVTWDGESDHVSKIEKLYEVENDPDKEGNRFNDGKCDSSGRLWAGTMGGEPVSGQIIPHKGAFYSFSNKKITEHLSQIGISNGLTWNDELKKMYYIDTHKGTIDDYDFDIVNGTISNSKSVFTLEKHGINGGLDGMTIDTDGNVWVAVYGANRVLKVDPRKSETLLQTIEIPANQVTSVAFGGSNLDELYVTTAKKTINDIAYPGPIHGGTYKVTGLNAQGYPGVSVVL